jgi:hypothetical protein
MNVVLNTANLDRDHLVFARDAAYVSPHARFDLPRNPRLTILRAEGEMIMERVGHGSTRTQSSLRDELTLNILVTRP